MERKKISVLGLTTLLLLAVLCSATFFVQAQDVTPEPSLEPIPGQPLPENLAEAAIINILPSAGGTTTPKAGAYVMANASSFNLQATPLQGWTFSHWVISAPPGVTTSHGSEPANLEPTANPYNVNHGYGATYNYQAVFTQTSGTQTATPTPTPGAGGISGLSIEIIIIIALVIVLLIVIVAALVALRRRR